MNSAIRPIVNRILATHRLVPSQERQLSDLMRNTSLNEADWEAVNDLIDALMKKSVRPTTDCLMLCEAIRTVSTNRKLLVAA
ncbi:hypothetical protein [Synechococcus sp. PCC 7336]|uniref:hypothetical protein n=1 Tax=Synechococcus sp. PCC 7336 TaxID=195250 RepID=UPI00034D1AB1|nr:hypothetical protein [Synechococcus sp. PCC 7336]